MKKISNFFRRFRHIGLGKYLPNNILSLYYKLNLKFHYYQSDLTDQVSCPICECKTARIFHYGPDKYATGSVLRFDEVSKGHNKYCCTNCKHVYATWLRKDLKDVSDLYFNIYDGEDNEIYKENDRKELQKQMVKIARDLYYSNNQNLSRGGGNFSALDFGCGPNFNAAYELRDEGIEAFCCDILPIFSYDDTVFFKYNDMFAETFLNKFDALCSVDVMEHLNYPLNDFNNFSKLLKQGGIMVHFSPILEHMPIFGSHVDTAFHTNFFCRKSLEIVCKKTGFEIIDVVLKERGFWYYVFKKI